MPQFSSQAEIEWTLFDHLTFLIRNWFWLLGGLLLFGATSIVLATLLFSTYTAAGLLRVGSAYYVGTLEPASEVATRISSNAFRGEICRTRPELCAKGSSPFTLSASSAPNSALVQILALSRDPALAEEVVRVASARIVADHQTRRERIIALVRARVKEVTEQIGRLERSVSAAPGSVGTPPSHEADDAGPSDATALAFAEARRSELLAEVAKLRAARLELELRGDPQVVPATHLMDGPTVNQRSPARRAGLVGAACGLLLVAFILYFLEERQHQRSPSPPGATT